MDQIPQPVHDVTDRDRQSGKQSSHRTNEENGDADHFGLPDMRRGAKIGGEAEVKGGNDDEERGPEDLFPSSLEDASKDNDASDRAEQTDNRIQYGHDEPADELRSEERRVGKECRSRW